MTVFAGAVHRGCTKKMATDEDTCERVGRDGCKICNKDGCNSAASLATSMFAVLISLFFAMRLL